MSIETIIQIIYYCIAFLVAAVSFVITIVTSIKARRKAKTKEEKEAIEAELKEQAKEFIKAAEIAYKDVNDILKSKGSSAGPMKLDSVLSKLQALATEKNYIFDVNYWTKYINDEVEFTREVNSKEN